ncbi:MAG: phosphatidate cytidylyltransferase [Proteobacteria bacterium]|nr:phosphatidate cytidylyltransferase [Pseudomonadota bacterium]
MLKERIVTAAILLAVFLSALFMLPTGWFALPVGAVIAVAAFEWAGLAKTGRPAALVYAGACAGIFAAVVWGAQAIDPARPGLVVTYALASAFWVLAAPVWLWRGLQVRARPIALAVGGVVVIPAGLSMVSLHFIAPVALLMVLAFIWIADIAAYFAGRAFGRRKLAPAISPGKTWEGAAGALAGTIIYAIICAVASPPLRATVQGGGWFVYLGCAVLLCAISIVGDLFESLMKRQAMVKDSGNLLPGHGGVLDRIDSITSTLPLAALIFYLVAGGA